MGIPDLDLVNISNSDTDSHNDIVHSPKVRYKPVSKWNIKFSGEMKIENFSLSAFLERVEETRIARNVTEQDLFNSAIDLFSGKALIWYRSIRKTVRDWPAL